MLKICSQSTLENYGNMFPRGKKNEQMSLCGESQFDSQLRHLVTFPAFD
jgi:hypothetical protein